MELTRRRFLEQAGVAAATTLVSATGFGQPPETTPKHPPGVEQYLKGVYAEKNRLHTFRPEARGGFKRWQAMARPALRKLIGLDNIAQHVARHKTTVKLDDKRLDRNDYTLRKGQIETEPNVRIPFWLLTPKGKGPFPLAMLPHGHDRHGHDTYAGVFRDEAHRVKSLANDSDVAVQAVKRGFVAIAPAIRGLATAANGVVRQRPPVV